MPPSVPNPRVFISYSHDSRDHCRRALDLTQQLRRDGIAAELDQFHENELHHWPRWCEEQMRPENADFVLCVCTPEYRRRVEGRVPADVGKGVFWEGTLIYNQVYDAKNNRRCVPVLLDGAGEADIPAVLGGYTWFRLDGFGLGDAESGYARLYRLLTRQPGVVGAGVGEVVRLPSLPEGGPVTDFFDEMKKIREGVARIEQKGEVIHSEQIIHERKSRRRHGAIMAGLLTVSGIGIGSYWYVSDRIEQKMDQAFVADPVILRAQFEKALEKSFQAKLAELKAQAAPPADIDRLYRLRDAQMQRLDEAVRFIQASADESRSSLVRQAVRTLQERGVDAALEFLEKNRAERGRRIREEARELAEAALFEAELHEGKLEFKEAQSTIEQAVELDFQWWEPHNRLGLLAWKLAQWDIAEKELKEAKQFVEREKELGSALNNLGASFLTIGHLSEAELLTRRALAITEKSQGIEHPDVAAVLSNLARVAQLKNHFTEAELLYKQALAISKKSHGAEHPMVAVVLNNLATLFRDTNRLPQAESLERRVVDIFEKSFGQNHPQVAHALNGRARLLRDMNRLSDAEPLLRKALAINERNYGLEHPEVIDTLDDLAKLLQATNRLEEAESLMRQALKVSEQGYGLEHPIVAVHLNNLVKILYETNQTNEAEVLARRALAISENNLGPEHSHVSTSLNNLAVILSGTDRLSDAEPIIRRALTIDEKLYGAEHPIIAVHLSNLAQLLQDTNRLADAERLMRRALAIDEQSYIPEHESSAVARDLNNLAELLYETQRPEEAERLMRRALVIFLRFTRTSGHEYPHLREAFGNYKRLLEALHLNEAQAQTRLADLGPEAGYTPDEWRSLQAGL